MFEFDPDSGDLAHRGHRIKIQNQVSQVLAILIAHAGVLVSREEFRRVLWPQDTYVDSERGLNKAICTLRATLRDSVSKPTFIETVPRKGYRFVGVVETMNHGLIRATDAKTFGRIGSLAVLPLANHLGDRDDEYFADGMTEELISAVSRIRSLRVISRTSVMRFKETRKSITVIARELGVDAIIEGSIARSDGNVRITAQLILAADDRHLWAGRFERQLRNVLELQAEIAQRIAHEIHAVVDPGDPVPLPVAEAYEAFLKANYFRDKMTPEHLGNSVSLYRRAIELDPAYAQAYAGLAEAYFFQGVFGIAPSREVFPKARSSALRALDLDAKLGAAYNALAAVRILYDWDWPGAEAACRNAITLSPGDPAGHVHLADYLSIQGAHDEAIARFRQALTMDPISRVYLAHFALILYRARRFEEAIDQCQRALDIDPTYANAMWFMALAIEKEAGPSDSIPVWEKAVAVSGGAPYFRALLGRAYAHVGERARAVRILKDLEAHESPFNLAIVHLALGNLEMGFDLLEEAYEQRVFRLLELTWPMFDDVRGEPRVKAIVRRIGLLV